MSGIYIHIPFCRRKCFYCDFYSIGSRNAPWQDYAKAVASEAHRRHAELDATVHGSEGSPTLYIGGGTPSQMPAEILSELIGDIKKCCGNSSFSEFTVELNPEDVTASLADILIQCGVNRVSMGIQSFVDRELQAIGRRHTATQAIEAYDILRQRFNNVSIDLIFGLPLQTLDSWEKSVSRAISLAPAHISAYSLMWEEKTTLMKMQSLGKVDECDEGLSREMFDLLSVALDNNGYMRYEISNYCLPGFESLHNSSYWRGEPYIGLGPGAHSYDGKRLRRSNLTDIKSYINHFYGSEEADIAPFYEQELLTDVELHEEYIMTRLRRAKGIELRDYTAKFGEQACTELVAKAKRYPGLLQVDNGQIYLSHEGILLSDSAIVALI